MERFRRGLQQALRERGRRRATDGKREVHMFNLGESLVGAGAGVMPTFPPLGWVLCLIGIALSGLNL